MQQGGFTEDFVLKVAKDAYEHGSATFEIVPAKCALIVVDMQDEFVEPCRTPFWVPEATRQVPKIRKLIDSCRKKNMPIIFTAFAETHHNLDRPISGKTMPNRYGQIGVQDPSWFRDGRICSGLGVLDSDIVIHKPSYGAFYDTPLETILKNLSKDTVIVCGTLTNFCCGTTARQAYERGFKVVFGSDVTATDDPSLQEPELKVLRKGFARVMTMDEIIATLQ